MTQSNVVPSETTRTETEIGLVFEDQRTNELQKVIYVDERIVLTRDTSGHTFLTPRTTFESQLGNRYSPRPDAEPPIQGGQVERLVSRIEEYERQDSRKARHKAEALTEGLVLLTSSSEGEKETDREEVRFEDIDGVGPDTAARLRSNGFVTRRDILIASDEDLLSVSRIGEATVANIREFVE